MVDLYDVVVEWRRKKPTDPAFSSFDPEDLEQGDRFYTMFDNLDQQNLKADFFHELVKYHIDQLASKHLNTDYVARFQFPRWLQDFMSEAQFITAKFAVWPKFKKIQIS